MEIRQPPAEEELTVEIPAALVEEIDAVVTYLEEQGKDATRSRVVEYIVHQHLRSSRQAVKAFRDWKRTDNE